jgi:hypothetical protein
LEARFNWGTPATANCCFLSGGCATEKRGNYTYCRSGSPCPAGKTHSGTGH